MIRINEIREFSHKGIVDFGFKYPVFEGWEPKATQWQTEGSCVIFLNYPDDIEFEIAPQIRISILKQIIAVSGQKTKLNPNGVYYAFVYDPSLFVSGHIHKQGEWNYLDFYGRVFGVRIEIVSVSLKKGFSKDKFFEKIIETFHFCE